VKSRGIIVVTSCTARKVASAERPTTAESLYRGEQHVRLMRGVRAYRHAKSPAGPLSLRILSAGHGLLPASRAISAYDHTFQGQPRDAIRARAEELQVPRQLRRLLARPYRLALLLLGDDYLEACRLNEDVNLGGPTLALCGRAAALRFLPLRRLRAIPLGNAEARRFSCGLVALKGELGGRILEAIAEDSRALPMVARRNGDLMPWLDARPRVGEAVGGAN
jgi:hypothetical protein